MVHHCFHDRRAGYFRAATDLFQEQHGVHFRSPGCLLTEISCSETGKVVEDYAKSNNEIVLRSEDDRILFGQSLGTAASSLMGGFGGCGLIPQTLLNCQAGGRYDSFPLVLALLVYLHMYVRLLPVFNFQNDLDLIRKVATSLF